MTERVTWAGRSSRFPEVPFRRLMQPIKRKVVRGDIVTAYTNGQVTLRSNRAKIGYHEATDLSTYQGVEPGDFVVHGLDILRGSVGVSDAYGAISPVVTVCQSAPDVDGRFIAYAMRAQAWTGFPKAMARGIRDGGADFRRWETLGELPVPCPSLEDQRRIADFLDAETARIDRLLALRSEQIRLADERLRSRVAHLLLDASSPLMSGLPLRRLIQTIKTGTTPSVEEQWAWAEPDDATGLGLPQTLDEPGRVEIAVPRVDAGRR